MIKSFRPAILIACGLMLHFPSLFAQTSKIKLIDAYLNDANKVGKFNGNILIVDNNKVVIKKVIGYADASIKILLTPQYRFHIGSIAKEFDAVGVMMLADQGKLKLTDKLSQFFPELPPWANTISITNLLQYTSGMPDIKWATVHNDADNWKNLQLLTRLDFEPGTKYAYNNNNTFLRRRIIEKVSGLSFNDFVRLKILKPVGIKNALVDPDEKDELMAKSFNDDFKQDGLGVPISGWVCLNLDDFYKWSQCINHYCIINSASTKEIITPFEPGKQCGLGGGTIVDGRIITHVHDGTALHYQALESADTPKGRTIIILSNQRQNNVYDIAEAITAILEGKRYTQLSKIEH